MTYLDFINDFRKEINDVQKYVYLSYKFKSYKKLIFKSGDSIKITHETVTIIINEKQKTINFNDILGCCAFPTRNRFLINCIDVNNICELKLK